MDEVPKISLIQIRPGQLIFYDMSYWHYIGSIRSFDNGTKERIQNPTYTGKINFKVQSKIRFSINLLIAQAKWKEHMNIKTGHFYKFKVNFVTLTLSSPQKQITDRQIKTKMLEPWLRNMRNVYGLRSYVWRAERQKNGNLHFHICTDTFLPLEAIRDVWNAQQAKFHFITDFQNRIGSEFPNSTDVHSVKAIRNLASYLVKYMAKDEKGLESIQGKIWDCSKNLKCKDRVTFELSVKDYQYVHFLERKFPKRFRSNEFCSTISLTDQEMEKYLPADYLKKYQKWLDQVYENGAPPKYYRI